MIEPENMPFEDASGEESVNNIRHNESDEAGKDSLEINPSDLDRMEQATRASEASFTLDADKGIAPAPDTNSDDEPGEYNVKQ